MGSVIQAKVLGSLELIDEGETDHKVIMLRSTDPHFSEVDTQTLISSIQEYWKSF